MSYQGFVSSELDKDSLSVRMFADKGMDMCLAQSFAKNFGLYGEKLFKKMNMKLMLLKVKFKLFVEMNIVILLNLVLI